MAKKSFKSLTTEELISYEKMASIICSKYEKSIKNYDNTIIQNNSEYNLFNKYNRLYQDIIYEMENRLNEFV